MFLFPFREEEEEKTFFRKDLLIRPSSVILFSSFFFLPSRNSQIAKNRWMYCSSPSAAAAVQRKIID